PRGSVSAWVPSCCPHVPSRCDVEGNGRDGARFLKDAYARRPIACAGMRTVSARRRTTSPQPPETISPRLLSRSRPHRLAARQHDSLLPLSQGALLGWPRGASTEESHSGVGT